MWLRRAAAGAQWACSGWGATAAGRGAAQLCEGRADRPAMMTLMKDVALPADLAGLVGAKAGAEKVVTKVQHFEDDPVLFEYCKVRRCRMRAWIRLT